MSAIASTLDISCPPTDQALADAATVTGRNAADKDDLVQLLNMLGLPTGEDDLVRLLPLLPDPSPHFDDSFGGFTVPTDTAAWDRPATDTEVDLSDLDQPTTPATDGSGSEVDPMLREMVLSMSYGDTEYNDDQISEATGLTREQIRDLINGYEADFGHATTQTTADPAPAAPAAVPLLPTGQPVEALIAWGAQHPAKGIQALAVRARTALADLAARYANDQAVVAAETRVETLRVKLAAAEKWLRDVKAGKTTPALTAVPAPATVGERLEQPDDKETRRRIRAWAREQGLYPADKGDRGLISQEILRAWNERGTDTSVVLAQAG